MTAGSGDSEDPADLFAADFHPQPGEHAEAGGAEAGGPEAADAEAGDAEAANAEAGDAEAADAEAGDAEAADAEAVREYLTQVSKVPGLTADQEAELARQIETGLAAERKLAEADERLAASERVDLEWAAEVGTRARKHLLEANLRLVVAVARRFTGRGVPFPDLIHEGNLGLIRAVEHFDYTKGDRFTAYATWWIRQAITRALAGRPRPSAGE